MLQELLLQQQQLLPVSRMSRVTPDQLHCNCTPCFVLVSHQAH